MRVSMTDYGQLLILHPHITLEPTSRRIKMYRLPNPKLIPYTMHTLPLLAEQKKCNKLLFYVTDAEAKWFRSLTYRKEGYIPRFFSGKENAHIFVRYLNPKRSEKLQHEAMQAVLSVARHSEKTYEDLPLPAGYTMRNPTEADAPQMAHLYARVFKTYPTPMDDPQYIIRMMHDHVYFMIVEYDGQIVSASSADLIPDFQAAEMTDCATLPEHRNQGLISRQFARLMIQMKDKGVRTLFCYSRALSVGMNMINVRHGFRYGGRLIQNSNIGGRLESMNVWYKNIDA